MEKQILDKVNEHSIEHYYVKSYKSLNDVNMDGRGILEYVLENNIKLESSEIDYLVSNVEPVSYHDNPNTMYKTNLTIQRVFVGANNGTCTLEPYHIDTIIEKSIEIMKNNEILNMDCADYFFNIYINNRGGSILNSTQIQKLFVDTDSAKSALIIKAFWSAASMGLDLNLNTKKYLLNKIQNLDLNDRRYVLSCDIEFFEIMKVQVALESGITPIDKNSDNFYRSNYDKTTRVENNKNIKI